MTIYQTDPLHDARWSTLLQGHVGASVFHTRSWLLALRQTYGYEPVSFTQSPPGAPSLEGGVVFCRVNSWLTGNRMVSLPFSDHCEPLAQSAGEACALLQEFEVTQAGQWKYLEIRSRLAQVVDLGKATGFKPHEEFILHMLDLRPDLSALLRSFHIDSVQRKIRRAEREKLEYAEGRSENHLRMFYRLLLLTRRRHRLPPQPLQWFRNLAGTFGDHLKIRIVKTNGRPIASIMTLRHGKTMVYKYGCSDASFHNLGGMALLFWRAIQEAKQLGLEEFDFGRTEPGQTGLAVYKDHWGARRFPLTYWRSPGGQLGSRNRGLRSEFASWFFGSAPAPLLSLTGRVFYRHMG